MADLVFDLSLSRRNEFLEKSLSFDFNKNIPDFNEVVCLRGDGFNSTILFSYYFNGFLIYFELENVNQNYLFEATEAIRLFEFDFNYLKSTFYDSYSVFELLNKQLYFKTCFQLKCSDIDIWQSFFLGDGKDICEAIIEHCKDTKKALKVISEVDLISYFNNEEAFDINTFTNKLPSLISDIYI